MSHFLQEEVERALKKYGEHILTQEGMYDCIDKFGLQVYEESKNLYLFRLEDHPIPEYYQKQVEKRIQQSLGHLNAGDILGR